jgi:hypothetical protein
MNGHPVSDLHEEAIQTAPSSSDSEHVPSEEDEQRDSTTDDRVSQCSVCTVNRSVCLMQPCAHLCMCVKCTRMAFKDKPYKCPICRIDVEDIKIVYQ